MKISRLVSRWIRPTSARTGLPAPVRPRRRCVLPAVEPLEARRVLDATLNPITGPTSPTALYLDGLYRDLLGRSAQSPDLNGWASVLAQSPLERSQLANSFLNSLEYQTDLIRSDYQTLLGRAPDPTGQASWLQLLQTGGAQELLTAQLVSSEEYYAKHGGEDTGWLTGVYEDLLGRAPDPSDLSGGQGLLQNGTPRLAIALAIAASNEADTRFVDAAYQDYLKREATPAEVSGWVSTLQHGWNQAGVLTQFASSDEYYQNQQGPGEPLLHQANLQYVGAFRVPAVPDPLQPGDDTYSFGGTALAFDPTSGGLFLVGMPYDQAISEISIPTSVVNSPQLDALATAQVLQPPVQVLPQLPSNPLPALGNVDIGGLTVDHGQLVGTAYAYYDAAGAATVSHFTLSSLTLAAAKAGGLYQVGNLGAGLVGGYLTPVPSAWQASLGDPYLTGQADISIISRTSSGPAAFGFDPRTLGPGTAPITPYLYYPVNTPLGPYVGPADPLQSGTSQVNGAVFVPGTRSILFVGSTGTNYDGYGLGSDFGDRNDAGKGPHSLNGQYAFQVWAYDALDFQAVKEGKLQPSQIKPYDVWNFDVPITTGSKQIGGVAFDPSTGRLYVSILGADNEAQYSDLPLIEVFQVNSQAPGTGGPAAPHIGTLAATPQGPGITGSTSPVPPGPVPAGTSVVLTAGNVYDVNPGGSVSRVAFYLDTNGDGKLELGTDTLLGDGTADGSANWTLTIPTTGLGAGTHTIFAEAQDSVGLFSDPLALPLAVV